MKKYIWIIIAIIIIELIWLGVSNTKETDVVDGEVIKIGAILGLTGDSSRWGENERMAIELAIEKINNEGGINGKLVEVIYEDSGIDLNRTVSAFHNLTDIKDVKFILGPTWSDPAIVLGPLAKEKKVIIIAASASLLPEEKDFVFSTWPPDKKAAEVLANQVYKDGFKEVAVLSINYMWGDNLENSFVDKFKELGGDVIYQGKFPTTDKDVKTEILKIKESNPQALYLVANVPEALEYFKRAEELDFKLPIYGTDTTPEDPELLKSVGNLIDGVKYFMPKEANNTEFINAFKNKFNKEPAVSADEMYDSAMILFESLENCSDFSNSCVSDYIKNIRNYSGASGMFSFDKNGYTEKEFYLKVVKNGEFVSYGEN